MFDVAKACNANLDLQARKVVRGEGVAMGLAPAVWFPTIRTGTGTDVFTIRLAEALEKRGVRTHITWLPHRAEVLPWTVAVPKPPAWVGVVHINSWLHRRFIPSHLPILVTFHTCIHDTALNSFKSPIQRLYHKNWIWRREIESIERASALTAVSEYTAKRAEQVFSCAGVVPIHNWVDTQKFRPSAERLPHSPFRLLFMGNARRRLKGADLLPSIMRNLGSGFELQFTGSLDDFGGEKNLPPNIRAIGRLRTEREVVAAYQAADVLIFPTRIEGFGLVALEAQSCGVPVVATNGSSLPEVVESGVTGQLCPQDDVLAFSDAVRDLRDNSERWAVIRSAARHRAETLFSERSALDGYIALYQRLTSSASSVSSE